MQTNEQSAPAAEVRHVRISSQQVFALSRSQSNSSTHTNGSSGRCSPDSQRSSSIALPSQLQLRECAQTCRTCVRTRADNHVRNHVRTRAISGSKSEDHEMTTNAGRRVYTKGRPPWYDRTGKMLKDPFIVGICGGSASGKTTVADRIIELLEISWVTVLSMDSFYKVLSPDDHNKAACSEYNFDHPDAFDFDLLLKTLERLRSGRKCDVPVYDFTTHRREKNSKIMYGADVIVFEGILAFHKQEIRDIMDLKIFVDTDADTRLARRLKRDIVDRHRDVDGVMAQYFNHVKPAFDTFIAPSMKYADIIIPRGGDNIVSAAYTSRTHVQVAIDLIMKQIKSRLTERGYDDASLDMRLSLMQCGGGDGTAVPVPDSLHVVPQGPQVLAMHTIIRDKNTPRDTFIFYSQRLMRIVIEHSLAFMPDAFVPATVSTGVGAVYEGRRRTIGANICCVSIMRAGETMEQALRDVVKDCKMGKILIQTNADSMEPELYYTRLPKDVSACRVFVLDAAIATGAAAMMAIRILLDHDVAEEHITLLSLLMARTGVHSIAYAFPKVSICTTAVDEGINDRFWIVPGVGNFGDRYYGTEHSPDISDSDEEVMAITKSPSARAASACCLKEDSPERP